MKSKDKPYVLFVAEVIYSEISKIKKNNLDYSNIDAIDGFIGTEIYKKISSGKFHDEWLGKLEKNNFIDPDTKKKIPDSQNTADFVKTICMHIGEPQVNSRGRGVYTSARVT